MLVRHLGLSEEKFYWKRDGICKKAIKELASRNKMIGLLWKLTKHFISE